MSEFSDWAASFEAKAHNRLQAIENRIADHRWYYVIAAVSVAVGFLFGFGVAHH